MRCFVAWSIFCLLQIRNHFAAMNSLRVAGLRGFLSRDVSSCLDSSGGGRETGLGDSVENFGELFRTTYGTTRPWRSTSAAFAVDDVVGARASEPAATWLAPSDLRFPSRQTRLPSFPGSCIFSNQPARLRTRRSALHPSWIERTHLSLVDESCRQLASKGGKDVVPFDVAVASNLFVQTGSFAALCPP